MKKAIPVLITVLLLVLASSASADVKRISVEKISDPTIAAYCVDGEKYLLVSLSLAKYVHFEKLYEEVDGKKVPKKCK